jgi:hypothetical protein
MRNPAATISLVFAAGALGGLANGLIAWMFGVYGIPAALGITAAPVLTPPWLYQRLVWGGIWGFLFLLPLLRGHWFTKGLILSLGPTLIQLFVIFPQARRGLLGLDLGILTPLLVIFYNAVWGWTAGIWLNWTGRRA